MASHQVVFGEEVRADFFRKMWLPLAALLFAGNNMTAFASLLGIACVLFVVALVFAIVKVPNWFTAWIQSFPAFAVQVIGLPFMLCHLLPIVLSISPYNLHHPFNGTINATDSSETHENLSDWQAVIVSAALSFLILVYCLSTSKQRKCPIPWTYHMFMLGLTTVLFVATGIGMVKIENLVVYFKTASLVFLLCCAPHLFPGLNSDRSSGVVGVFIFFVLPVTLVVVWLRMKYEYTSNDSVMASVDEYKLWTGVMYLMLYLWDTFFNALDEEEMENLSSDRAQL